IVDTGDVGGADFAQLGTAGGHDIRDAKTAADLDELPARDDRFALAAEGAQHDDGGGGVVVDDGRALGPGKLGDPVADRVLARGALAGLQIHFEVEIAAPGIIGSSSGHVGDRRPYQVRVQHDDGG